MNSGTIIAGVIAILLVVVIYVMASKSKKKKEIMFLQPLDKLAKQNNGKISKHEIWNNSVIGIDNTAKHVFYLRKTEEGDVPLVVNLDEMQKCRVATSCRMAEFKDTNAKIYDRIELAFAPKEKGKSETIVEFYNSKTDRLTLAGELQLADKWCKLINERIA